MSVTETVGRRIVAETMWGIDATILHAVMALIWGALLVMLVYQRSRLSRTRFYLFLCMGILWLSYSLMNLFA